MVLKFVSEFAAVFSELWKRGTSRLLKKALVSEALE